MKTLMFAYVCLMGCAYGDPIFETQEDAGNEATVYLAPKIDVQFHCSVDYITGVNNPCDGPSPCWQWMRDGILLPKGASCQFDCVCATPNSSFGKSIECGCGGFCHAGGCFNSL